MEYQQQDFSAIDKHIAWEQYKKEQLLNERWARNWMKWIKVFVLLVASLGLLFILIATGIYVLERAYKPVDVFSFSSSNVNQKDIKLLIDGMRSVESKLLEIEKKSTLTEKEILQKIQDSESSKLEQEQKIKTSFTVFETVDNIVTGRVYSPENLSSPESQYCYITTPMEGDQTKSIKQDLAIKTVNLPIEHEQGITAEQKVLVNTKCRFIDVEL